VPSLAPLVEQRKRKDEREDRADGRQDDAQAHLATKWLGGDQFVRLTMQTITQAPARLFAGDGHWAHDLAHV